MKHLYIFFILTSITVCVSSQTPEGLTLPGMHLQEVIENLPSPQLHTLKTQEDVYRQIASSYYYSTDGINYTPSDSGDIFYASESYVDKNINYLYNEFTSAWGYSGQGIYLYDADMFTTSYLYQTYDGSDFVNYSQNEYTYNADGYTTSNIYQLWTGADWYNSEKANYTYTSENYLETQIIQSWGGSSWVNINKTIYTYTPEGWVQTIIYQSYYADDWVNSYKYTYTYVGALLMNVLTQIWDGTAWQNYSQSIYAYDSEDKILSYTTQGWGGSSWNDVSRLLYEYDAGSDLYNLTTYQTYFGTWNDFYRNNFSYTSFGSFSEIIRENYSSGWVNSTKYIYSYDAYENYTGYETEYWDAANTDWDKAYIYNYYYDGYVDILNPVDQGGGNVYPNPFVKSFTITLPGQNYANAWVTLLNMEGKVVYKEKYANLENKIHITSDLPAGNYYYSIATEQGLFSGKVSKQ